MVLKKFYVCFVVMFVGLFHSVNGTAQSTLTYKNSMTYNYGMFIDSWVSGHYLYTVTERGLMIYDINAPQSPQLVGTLGTPGKAQAVRVVGNYAYILDEGIGLLVVNVTNAGSPVITDTLSLGQYPNYNNQCPDRMQVSGNYLYVSRHYGLKVYSLFNPAVPIERDSIYLMYTNNGIYDFAISGNYAYLSTQSDSGLVILNISNPDSIFTVRCFHDSIAYARGIEVKDSLAYLTVTYPEYGLKIINIKNPNNPSVIGFFNAGDNHAFYDVKIVDTLAYCDQHGGILTVLNITHPTAPDSIGQPLSLGGWEGNIDIFGNIMLMSVDLGSIHQNVIINMTDKVNPSVYHTIANDKGPFVYPVCYGNKLILSNTKELLVHNLTNPLAPTYVNKSDGFTYRLVASDKYIYYMSDSPYALRAISLNNYSLKASIPKNNSSYFMDILRSEKGYIIGKRDSLFIYDDTLGIVGFWPDAGTTCDIYVKGDSVYALNQTAQDFKVINISDPTNPTLSGAYPAIGLNSDFVVVDSLAYFMYNTFIKSYRRDNVLGMVGVDSLDINEYSITRMTNQGEYIYLTAFEYIIIIKINPDNSMTEVGRYNTTGKPYAMSFYGPYIYLGDTYSVGIYEFPISLEPKIISKSDTILTEDSTFSYNVFATACPLPSYSLITNPAGMTLDSTTGEIEWTPTNANVGDTVIRIVATNSVSSDTQTYNLHILNSAPHFTSTPDTIAVFPESLYTYDANSDDEGQGNTFYTGLALPVWLTLDSLTGVLSGNLPDSSISTTISLKVDDGNAKADTQSFTIHFVGVEEKIDSIPTVFKLSSIKPNPFGKMVNIQYALPKDSKVNLSIYNLCGQNVATLVNDTKKVGYHTVCWKPSGQFASNVYFIKFSAGEYRETKKLLLMK
ncbi:MAG: putative Ig domain-containing protein [bacterium]|nr:putative Ig domain-containing protein [bacterium]